jgi:N-formylmaleamate deformylase
MTAAEVTVGSLTLHYHRTGGTGPVLVLSHGVTDDGLCWMPVIQALGDAFDVIMPDARGHGGSGTPSDGYAMDRQADDLAGLIRALSLDRPFVGGHSMGAVSSLIVAARCPDLVGALVMEDPPLDALWGVPSGSAVDAFAEHMEPWLSGLQAMSRQKAWETCRRENPDWSDEEIGPWIDSKLRARIDFRSLLPPSLAWQEAFARVKCPTLLLAGNREKGGVLSTEEVEEARRRLPGLEVASFPNTGHNVSREDFGRYMSVVVGFLARVGKARA